MQLTITGLGQLTITGHVTTLVSSMWLYLYMSKQECFESWLINQDRNLLAGDAQLEYLIKCPRTAQQRCYFKTPEEKISGATWAISTVVMISAPVSRHKKDLKSRTMRGIRSNRPQINRGVIWKFGWIRRAPIPKHPDRAGSERLSRSCAASLKLDALVTIIPCVFILFEMLRCCRVW